MKFGSLTDGLLRRMRAFTGRKKKPSSQKQKWKVIDDIRRAHKLDVLVESGTFLGDTIEHFKDCFAKLYSIELQNDLYHEAQQKFSRNPRVTIILGDSGQVLKGLVPKLDKAALFWLDGHYSSEFYIGEKYITTARGSTNTPIEEELKAILASPMRHIILIDDARLFGVDRDYPRIAQIKNTVRKYKDDYYMQVSQDIIRILPKASH